jgi:hypothetical protein
MNNTAENFMHPIPLSARLARFFFMHLGSFVAVFVYFHLGSQAEFSTDGVRSALLIGLLVMSAYIALAFYMGELKYFDFGLWFMFALGTLSAYTGIETILRLFQWYSPAILFLTLGLVALIPLLLGRETFTYYFARRKTPLWQQRLPTFAEINRVMTAYWACIFFLSSGLSAYSPLDWRFTFLYPNLLIFLVGIPAEFWLPPLYLKLFPAEIPRNAEALIMGLPFSFNQAAAKNAQAIIQFHVSGAEKASYYVSITRGKCASFIGKLPTPDLTIHTPETVWVRIAHGELDGAQALQEGLYKTEGDSSLLLKFREWFSKSP